MASEKLGVKEIMSFILTFNNLMQFVIVCPVHQSEEINGEGILPFPGERRQAQRRRVKLEASLQADLSLLDAETDAGGAPQKGLTLLGNTHDLSATGMSLVLPSFPVDERFCEMGDRKLRISFYLPSGPVEIEVAPVRCVPLHEKEPRRGYFIGARIVEMSDNEHNRLVSYLRAVSQSH
jgi:hypothetical protein